MRKYLALIAVGLALLASPAKADWTGKDAAGATITFENAVDCTVGVCIPIAALVNAAGTTLYGTAGTANASVLTVQGIAAMTPFLSAQSGTWTVQPGNTANTTPWLVTVDNTLAAVANNADNVAAGAGAASPVVNYNYAFDGTTWDRVRTVAVDPCEATLQTYAPISITTATTTRIVAPSASNKTYICSLFLTSAAADNIGIVEGTGGTCGTGTAGVIGGTTAANGPNFAANGGMLLQAGGKVAVAQTAGTNVDLCLITSAATPLAGGIKYVQAP